MTDEARRRELRCSQALSPEERKRELKRLEKRLKTIEHEQRRADEAYKREKIWLAAGRAVLANYPPGTTIGDVKEEFEAEFQKRLALAQADETRPH